MNLWQQICLAGLTYECMATKQFSQLEIWGYGDKIWNDLRWVYGNKKTTTGGNVSWGQASLSGSSLSLGKRHFLSHLFLKFNFFVIVIKDKLSFEPGQGSLLVLSDTWVPTIRWTEIKLSGSENCCQGWGRASWAAGRLRWIYWWCPSLQLVLKLLFYFSLLWMGRLVSRGAIPTYKN